MNEFDYKGFWSDFTIADHFGIGAIEDTFNRAFEGWKDDVEYFTSLVLTLNHKIWQWYENGNDEKARVYDRLWRKADSYACENFKGEDAEYYFSTTD